MDSAHALLGRGAGRRRAVAVERGQRHRRRQSFLLQRRVERHVDGSLRQRHRDAIRAQDRFERRRHRSGLVVPLGVAAHQRAQVARRVDPVDPRPPLHGIDRPDAAQKQDRNAVAPGIEDRHRRVHQPDVGMQRDRERSPGDARIAVRERDRALLVQAEQHLRPRVAEIVDQAVVQAAIAGARIERDIGNLERAQQLCDDIAAPAGDRLNVRDLARAIVHRRSAVRLQGLMDHFSSLVLRRRTVAQARTRGNARETVRDRHRAAVFEDLTGTDTGSRSARCSDLRRSQRG